MLEEELTSDEEDEPLEVVGTSKKGVRKGAQGKADGDFEEAATDEEILP